MVTEAEAQMPTSQESDPNRPVGSAEGETMDAASLARQIRLKVEELVTVREQQRRLDQEHRDRILRLQGQVETLTKQTEEVETALRGELQEIAELEQRISQAESAAVDAGRWIGQVAALLLPVAERTLLRVATDASPEKPRRTGEFTAAMSQLRDEDPNRALAGFRYLVQLLGAEWTPARTVSLVNEPISLDGGERQIHSWVVGVGFVGKAFVSEDNQYVGISSGDKDKPWRLELSSTEASQARDLIKIVRGQKPPAIAIMPIAVQPNSTLQTPIPDAVDPTAPLPSAARDAEVKNSDGALIQDN